MTGLSQVLARSLVFVASAAVLIVEILATRLVAPYLGVSLEVFTGIIGVILAGISIGAWMGGRAADRLDPRALPGPLLTAGGLSSMASPLLVDWAGSWVGSGPSGIVVLTTMAFFAPAALLSAVPPVIVKIQLSSLRHTGSVVGSYSAVGTVGALFGTFVTGFVLIAAFPTRPITVAVGAVLTAVGLVIWPAIGRGTLAAVLVIGVALAVPLALGDGPCEFETAYSCAIVEVDPDRPTGRLLILDRAANSYVDLEDPEYLDFRYIRLTADVIAAESPPGPVRAVFVGGGGFTLPRYLESVRPGTQSTVLEIDPALVEIGNDELALTGSTDVIVGDARISIESLATDSADLIVGDAFSGFTVPWHLTTLEFDLELARVLAEDGVYVMNVIDAGNLDFVRSVAATLKAVWEEVAVFAPPSYLDGTGGGNFVLVASDSPIGVGNIEDRIQSRGGVEIGVAGDELERFVGDAFVLTDDYAPVDQMRINR